MSYSKLIVAILRKVDQKLDKIEERFMAQARKNVRNKKRNKNRKNKLYRATFNGFHDKEEDWAGHNVGSEFLNRASKPNWLNVMIFFKMGFKYFACMP